ncbi:MAG: hypothetical protein LBR74_07220 [Eubacterium sp.]|nr:hypothetical protein [Eubacterium sp.]
MLSIDITDSEVRIIRVALQGEKIRILKALTRDITPGVIENGQINDLFMLAGEITELLVSEKIPFEKAVLCINAGGILYKEIYLPKPRTIIPMQMEDMIMNEMGLSDTYNISYSIVDELYEVETGRQLKVIATACPQKIVDSYILLAKQIGLPLYRMVVGSNIVSLLIAKRPRDDNQSPFLLLQVDKKFININIYVDNNLVSSRYVQVDLEDYGARTADPINLCIFDNIFRLIHFFGTAPGTESIKHIGYFGHIENVDALESTLAQFNLPFSELGRPFELSAAFSGFPFTRFVNCVAACYKLNKIENDVDLLDSKEVRLRRKNSAFLFFAGASALIFAFIVIGLTIYTDTLVKNKNNELLAVQQQYEMLGHEELVAKINAMKAALSVFDAYVQKVNYSKAIVDFQYKMTPDILRKIKDAMFSGMVIEGDVMVEDEDVTATFICPDNSMPSAYVDALREQGYFESIDYKGYSTTEQGDFTFKLYMKIKGGNIFEA